MKYNKVPDSLYGKNKPRYNGEKLNAPLSSVNGIGTMFMGEYRQDYFGMNNTYAAYLFISFLYLPIIPIGCYRISKGSSFSPNHKRTLQRYKVYGTERWKIKEVLMVYLMRYACLAVVIGVIQLIDYIYELFIK